MVAKTDSRESQIYQHFGIRQLWAYWRIFIEIDNGESECRYSEWRNTEAKVKELQSLGIVHKDTFYFGGYGDCSEYHTDYAISLDGLEKLKADGWTFNQLKPFVKMKSEDIDAMAEILQEYGVSVPTDIIEKITSDL